jgi:hypothetical protein
MSLTLYTIKLKLSYNFIYINHDFLHLIHKISFFVNGKELDVESVKENKLKFDDAFDKQLKCAAFLVNQKTNLK